MAFHEIDLASFKGTGLTRSNLTERKQVSHSAH